jgi:hypothetical protein
VLELIQPGITNLARSALSIHPKPGITSVRISAVLFPALPR